MEIGNEPRAHRAKYVFNQQFYVSACATGPQSFVWLLLVAKGGKTPSTKIRHRFPKTASRVKFFGRPIDGNID
jgi:hypothetical protein